MNRIEHFTKASVHRASAGIRNVLFHPRYLVIYLATLTGLLLVTGCDSTEENQPADAFVIGVILPRTGSGASVGESAEAGINLTVEDIKAYMENTGDPLRVEAIFRDSETDPTTALEQLQDLYQLGVRHVIGPYASANVAAVLDYADENGIVLLSPSSVASSLAIADDNLFRLVPADSKQAAVVSALFSHDGISAIVPVVRDDVWGDGLLSDLNQIASQTALDVQEPVLYDPDDPNGASIASEVASSVAQALQQYSPSEVAVYLLSFGEGTDILEAAAGEPDCARVNWYGSSAFAKNAGLAENDIAAAFAMQQEFRSPSFAPDPAAADLWEPFSARLEASLGREPEVYALTTQDALWLMAQARLEQNGKTDIDSFKSALVRVAAHRFGITGRLVFDAYGDREQSTYDFWGLTDNGSAREWKSVGRYSGAGGLVIF